jgi:hypothetical protein
MSFLFYTRIHQSQMRGRTSLWAFFHFVPDFKDKQRVTEQSLGEHGISNMRLHILQTAETLIAEQLDKNVSVSDIHVSLWDITGGIFGEAYPTLPGLLKNYIL